MNSTRFFKRPVQQLHRHNTVSVTSEQHDCTREKLPSEYGCEPEEDQELVPCIEYSNSEHGTTRRPTTLVVNG